MANVEPVEIRNKMQEIWASTFSGALARFRKYLKPDIIELVNHTRAHNIAKHAETDDFDYKSRDTPKRANKVSDTQSRHDQHIQEVFKCDNCVVNNAPGNHKTTNCITFPAIQKMRLLTSPTSTHNFDALILEAIKLSWLRLGKPPTCPPAGSLDRTLSHPAHHTATQTRQAATYIVAGCLVLVPCSLNFLCTI